MAKSKEFIENLPELAWKYIEECLGNKIEKLSNSGKVIKITDRHIPTIDYFLRIWLPLNHEETFVRSTWYAWLGETNDEGQPNQKSDTIKAINEVFNSLAADIVANEGKGIFYAKNKLGMTDKMEHAGNQEQPLFGKDVNKS